MTTTAATLIADINAVRAQLDLSPIKGQGTSKADLTAMLTKLRAQLKSTKRRTRADDDTNTVSLADIARELGINPKVARAKARRHADSLTSLQVTTHRFTPEVKDQVVAILQRDFRRHDEEAVAA